MFKDLKKGDVLVYNNVYNSLINIVEKDKCSVTIMCDGFLLNYTITEFNESNMRKGCNKLLLI